jgi:hypothetical protein
MAKPSAARNRRQRIAGRPRLPRAAQPTRPPSSSAPGHRYRDFFIRRDFFIFLPPLCRRRAMGSSFLLWNHSTRSRSKRKGLTGTGPVNPFFGTFVRRRCASPSNASTPATTWWCPSRESVARTMPGCQVSVQTSTNCRRGIRCGQGSPVLIAKLQFMHRRRYHDRSKPLSRMS